MAVTYGPNSVAMSATDDAVTGTYYVQTIVGIAGDTNPGTASVKDTAGGVITSLSAGANGSCIITFPKPVCMIGLKAGTLSNMLLYIIYA